MDCKICYESKNSSEDFQWLDCTHSLCFSCYKKLQNMICPFCRTQITIPIVKEEKPVFRALPTIRFRRHNHQRRRRRNTNFERIIYSDGNNDENEEFRRLRIKKSSNIPVNDKKKQKYRFNRSQRWNQRYIVQNYR